LLDNIHVSYDDTVSEAKNP